MGSEPSEPLALRRRLCSCCSKRVLGGGAFVGSGKRVRDGPTLGTAGVVVAPGKTGRGPTVVVGVAVAVLLRVAGAAKPSAVEAPGPARRSTVEAVPLPGAGTGVGFELLTGGMPVPAASPFC